MSTELAQKARPLSITSTEHARAVDFLHYEAELLDNLQERAWLEELVSKDIVYQVPLRQTVERVRGNGVVEGMFHLNEDYGSLSAKVARNETQYAWAEDPPSRVRHFVTNVRVRPGEGDTLLVSSNLLIYRTRQDQTVAMLLSGERRDILRHEEGALRLVRRWVLLDVTVIGTHNLAIFF